MGKLRIRSDHRLICGDSTDAETYARLMDGNEASLMVTDLPYGASLGMNETPEQAKARNRRTDGLTIANDNLTDEELRSFIHLFLHNAFEAMGEGSAFYIWHADSQGFAFRGGLKDIDVTLRQCLVWVKDVMVMGRQDYHWQHEPCLYGWKDGKSHLWKVIGHRRRFCVFRDRNVRPSIRR